MHCFLVDKSLQLHFWKQWGLANFTRYFVKPYHYVSDF